MGSLLQWAPAATEGVFWFVIAHFATRLSEDPAAWDRMTPEQRTVVVLGLPYPTDVWARDEVLDEVLVRDPFRLDDVDARWRALERERAVRRHPRRVGLVAPRGLLRRLATDAGGWTGGVRKRLLARTPDGVGSPCGQV